MRYYVPLVPQNIEADMADPRIAIPDQSEPGDVNAVQHEHCLPQPGEACGVKEVCRTCGLELLYPHWAEW